METLENRQSIILTFLITSFLLLSVFIEVASASPKHYLITDTNNHRVIEVDVNKNITWQYGTVAVSNDIWEHKIAGIPGQGPDKLNFPLSALRLKTGNTLITDGGNQRVIEVSPEKRIVWEFTSKNIKGLFYPVKARRLKNGNTLITDWVSHRVVEVNRAKRIIWQYGELNYPQDAVRLKNGHTLITDSGNERVIEVNADKEIIWQFGVTGIAWVDQEHLNHPLSAIRLDNGNTLITDEENSRVIEVNADKKIVWQYGGSKGNAEGQLNYPYNAVRLDNRGTLIADQTNHRVIEVSSEGKIVWQYGDNYHPGVGSNQLLYPADAQEAVVPLNDPSIAKKLQSLPPLNDDKYSLSFLWIIGGWAAFCLAVVFGLYYFTSKKRVLNICPKQSLRGTK